MYALPDRRWLRGRRGRLAGPMSGVASAGS